MRAGPPWRMVGLCLAVPDTSSRLQGVAIYPAIGGVDVNVTRQRTSPASRRSPVPMVVCLLALATGLTLFGIGQSIAVSTDEPAATPGAAEVDLAIRFYAAANAVLRTGDATHLDQIVAPSMIHHSARALGESGRTSLAKVLLSRHAAFPGLRLIVDEARATGDIVAVQVRAEGGVAGSFLGLAATREFAAWGPMDIVRIAGGRIVERWGGGPDISRFEPLWQSSVSAKTPEAPQTVALRRVTWKPDAALEVDVNPAGWFLWVESGTLSFTVAGTPAADGHGPNGMLAPGDLLAVPVGTGFTVENAATVPARAFLVAHWAELVRGYGRQPTEDEMAVMRFADELGLVPGASSPYWLDHGVQAVRVTTLVDVDVPPVARLAMGRMILAPGDALTVDDLAGPLIVAIEAGRLDVTVAPHRVWAMDTAGRGRAPAMTTSLATGEGGYLTASTDGVWRAGGREPLVAWVLAMEPLDGEQASAGAATP